MSPAGSRERATSTGWTSTTVLRHSTPRPTSVLSALLSPAAVSLTPAVGLWNEKDTSRDYTLTLRRHLDEAGLTTKIITADGGWGICDELIKDPEYAAAVYGLGSHYPRLRHVRQLRRAQPSDRQAAVGE